MSENIEYNDSVIMDILKSKVSETLGDEAWISLTQGIQVPDIHKESNCGCSNMRELMKRFDDITDKATAKSILTHVRHGLKYSQFAWAKEKFAKYNDIDDFIRVSFNEEKRNFISYVIRANLFMARKSIMRLLNSF